MPTYKAPLDEIRFVLEDVLDVGQLTSLPGYEEATPEMLLAILAEGARLCEEVLAPLNQSGDAEGCRLSDGVVITPKGFKEAYVAYREGGWSAMTAAEEYGGQALPHVSRLSFEEMIYSSNLSFGMYPELAHGAIQLIERWASDELKQRYLPKMVDGSWLGTMCLTEAHAGTDLGMIRTKAVPAGDGAYLVTGTKIFISGGDSDLAENIVHLVLAKLPDAPPGTKGISLFLIPKRLPTDEGTAGTPNGISVGSLEHKMGIKGNATCVLNFEGSRGWLVGEPHKGMRAMFTMMNGARLGVGVQGLGLAEVAWQNALAYARDRIQGRALTGVKNPGAEADPILVHPDVRRMLMTMKVYVEGTRALAYWVGILMDRKERHPDEATRAEAEDLVALMTPVIKAFLTDVGFEVTNLGLQVFGGHGYIREYGMEQFARDARISQIYEGTNGVQAMDLIGRKVPEGDGRLVKRFLAIVQQDLAAATDERVAMFAKPLGEAVQTLGKSTMTIMSRAATNPDELGACSVDYLRIFGLVATGWMWLRMANAAIASGDRARTTEKLATARFYVTKLLPQVRALAAQIEAGAAPVMELDLATL